MCGKNTRFREYYKNNALSSTGAGRCRRAQKKSVDRRVSRIEEFCRQRNLAGLDDVSENREAVVDTHKLRLQKWKEDKLQRSLLKKASEKPAFWCGVVHHKIGSPYLNYISNVKNVARLDRLRLRQKTGAVAVEVPTTPVQTRKTEDCFPIQYSPFVTKERGSSRRRSHLVAEASEKSFGDVLCTTVSSAATTEENWQPGVPYFRARMEIETKRLDTVCQKWLDIKFTEPDLPQEASDMINRAVWQTQLLLSNKFCQFRNLIDTCENDSGTAKPSATCSDLNGFWDMMYMQVEDVDLRFRNLQKLKLNNWKEEEELVRVVGGLKKVQKSAESSLCSMIAGVSHRISLLGDVSGDISVAKPLPSGDLICLDSPVSGVGHRISLLGDVSGDISVAKPLPSGDLICLDSPVSVCLTLSSDDEESTQSDLDSTMTGERSLNNGQRLSTDGIPYNAPDPEVTSSAMGKEPVIPEEDDAGSDTGENQHTQGVRDMSECREMISDNERPSSHRMVLRSAASKIHSTNKDIAEGVVGNLRSRRRQRRELIQQTSDESDAAAVEVEEQLLPCPICGHGFPAKVIEVHASECEQYCEEEQLNN